MSNVSWNKLLVFGCRAGRDVVAVAVAVAEMYAALSGLAIY